MLLEDKPEWYESWKMSSCDPKCSSMEGAEQDTDEEQESDETEDSNIRKVLILYVGGTIGMKKNEDGGGYLFVHILSYYYY